MGTAELHPNTVNYTGFSQIFHKWFKKNIPLDFIYFPVQHSFTSQLVMSSWQCRWLNIILHKIMGLETKYTSYNNTLKYIAIYNKELPFDSKLKLCLKL